MAVTPVRHVRVPDVLWDAAKAKADSEFRDVSSVIIECLRRYTQAGGSPVVGTAEANGSVSVPTPALQVADSGPVVGTSVNGKAGAVATEGVHPPDVAAAVPTPAPRKRKAKGPAVTTAAELAKPPEEREDAMPRLASAVTPGVRYPCCKHCKSPHGGHGDPCMNGCHDDQA